MRIFIGRIEIAGIAATYAKGFRALGHETYTLVMNKNPFYPDARYDFVIDEHVGTGNQTAGLFHTRVRRIKQGGFLSLQLLYALATCDVFVFMFGTSLLPRFWDYPILKRMGKRLVTAFWGSDIRYWYAFEQEMRLLGMESAVRPFIDYIKNNPGKCYAKKLQIVQAAERYADLILSQPGYGQLQTRPYMRANIPLDLSQLQLNIPEREIPLILHTPSNRGVKGTEYVLRTIEQLKQEKVQFEFRLIEKMPNTELRELLADADIVVDELFSDTVGVLSLESMATGNTVLVRYPADHARVPPGCPAVNVTKDTLTDKLRQVILDRDLRRQLAQAGRPYVEAYHDHVQIARQILDWLKPGGIQEHDFVPTFYKDFAMPPELLEAERKVHGLRPESCTDYPSKRPIKQS